MSITHAFLCRFYTNSTITLELPNPFDNRDTLKAWLEWHMPEWTLLDIYEKSPVVNHPLLG